MAAPRKQPEISKMPKRIHIDFFVAIIVFPLLVLKVQWLFIKKGQFREGRKERLQRKTLNPLGAFILGRSGKSIS
jgi:cell division protein FtsI/penicillin-binding protein 2